MTLRHTRPLRGAVIAAALVAATLVIAVPGAVGDSTAVPAPPASPTSADQIQNIDQVKTAIKGYYGDTATTQVDPVPNTIDGGDKALHTFAAGGAYAHELAGIEADATDYLDKAAKQSQKFTARPAVVFDIDDTTLNTYSYEIYSNFVFSPTTNAAFVNAGSASIFPAVPGMPALEAKAEQDGYTVFFLTGRPVAQTDGTIQNLQDAGYDVDPNNVYLKDLTAPWLSSCAPSCSTIQYKTLTRQHIESLGYDIAANFGDQFSDLTGGFANQTFKIPNPMYFLP